MLESLRWRVLDVDSKPLSDNELGWRYSWLYQWSNIVNGCSRRKCWLTRVVTLTAVFKCWATCPPLRKSLDSGQIRAGGEAVERVHVKCHSSGLGSFLVTWRSWLVRQLYVVFPSFLYLPVAFLVDHLEWDVSCILSYAVDWMKAPHCYGNKSAEQGLQ